MKGTFFQKPLEFRLSVDGETWRQGDSIEGVLTAKNHAAGALPVAGITVCLARGVLRKVHQKSSDAFEILASASIPPSSGPELLPAQELSYPWKFGTDRNCPITDTLGSLFLLYGQNGSAQGAGAQLGNIQIPVLPYEIITQFLDVVKTGFRFVIKGARWSKGNVDAKLAPPDSRGFAMLEQLQLLFHFEGETLHVEYGFRLKTVEASAASVELKKQKTAFKQSYEPALYRTSSGRFDHERVEKEIRDVLDQIEAKNIL